jgi:hypothetical protein
VARGMTLFDHRREINPFRKFFGPCLRHCADSRQVRLFVCHLCSQIGCWDWLIHHCD